MVANGLVHNAWNRQNAPRRGERALFMFDPQTNDSLLKIRRLGQAGTDRDESAAYLRGYAAAAREIRDAWRGVEEIFYQGGGGPNGAVAAREAKTEGEAALTFALGAFSGALATLQSCMEGDNDA